MFNREFFKRNWITFFALSIAAIVLIFYIVTGNLSLDQNLKQLNSLDQVSNVEIETESTGNKLVTIECENGDVYQIYLPAEETDYQAIKNSRCN